MVRCNANLDVLCPRDWEGEVSNVDGGGPTQRPPWIPDEQWAYGGYDRLIRPELSLLWGRRLKDRDEHRTDVQERLNRFPDYWTKGALPPTTTATAVHVLNAPTVRATVSKSSSMFGLDWKQWAHSILPWSSVMAGLTKGNDQEDDTKDTVRE